MRRNVFEHAIESIKQLDIVVKHQVLHYLRNGIISAAYDCYSHYH